MHALAPINPTSARSVLSSSHPHTSAPSSTTAAPSCAAQCSVADSHSCVLSASAPQCCHCGWRGAHAPSCPFK
ncbi:hypothetical protein BC628DRAFT_1356106 [Trametes gibbosa]|nr:hypothetical protein BC628DRAFT_1356106 [Trametes gibbosa]